MVFPNEQSVAAVPERGWGSEEEGVALSTFPKVREKSQLMEDGGLQALPALVARRRQAQGSSYGISRSMG